jgi:O-antigen ligase
MSHLQPATQPATWTNVRYEAGPKFSVLFLSGSIAAAIPLVLSLYWFVFALAPESVGALLRLPVLGCSLLLAALWYRAPLSHAEVNLLKVLIIAAALWLIPSLTANHQSHAIGGWTKMLVLFVVCFCVARGLRHPATAHVFGLALLAGGLLLIAFILIIYVQHMGLVLPTYKTAREFKGVAAFAGVPLNSVAFAAVFSYLAGLSLVPTNAVLLLFGVPLFFTSSMFTGSRAPLVILGASVFILVCVNGWRSKSSLIRAGTVLVVLAALVGGAVVLHSTTDGEMNTATEGRSHLWSVGLQKFTERPLFGYGYESWRDDLVSRLPGEYDLTYDLAKSLGGGYHNEYVSVLAEEGLIGVTAAGLIIWLLLRFSWLLAFRTWATARTGQWPLFACLFLLLRSNFEVPGLFGYAQDPVDYLAYIFVAIVISRFSTEEDYRRLLGKAELGRAI